MSDGTIRCEVDGHVATVTIDRPHKLNAMTVAMDIEMNHVTYDLNNDRAVRCIILTGSGDRAFSAGSDITDLDEYGDNWQYRNRFSARKDYVRALWLVRKPIIAAVNGYAIGGGLEMICACDIRLATANSSFGAGEIRLGWHGGSGATQYLTRVIGPGHAAKLLLSGDRIDGNEAHRIGLVQELHEPARLMARARELAAGIAEKAPVAVESSKNLIRVAQSASIEVGLAYENDMFSYCMLTEDAAEGRAAFAEKRAPVFKGR